MSFYDVFRGFFGFPGRHRPRDPLFGGTAWDEEEEEDDDGPAPPQPPHDFAFGFGFSPDGTRGAFEELFRDMGELLGVFGGSWARPPPPLEPPLPGPSEGSAGRPLRDSMLKQPDAPSTVPGGPEGARDPPRPWRPFLGLDDAPPASPGPKEDQDLDSHVSSAGLGTILKPDEPKSRSYFQSVSVTKVTLPDGGSVLRAGGGGASDRAGQPGPPGDNSDSPEGGSGLHHHHQGGWAEQGLPGGGGQHG
ncbi:HCLS1-associated protein X-1 isoform X2 [Falco biarmicus]|uniref:HCLS1-associated protein X-1 isoform X2 n=1 Tax=Falco biarmicus TaxID=345155 RepID=UPI0024BC5616|nr:HCLS1-associated protein X-1 isoform X2 [Falco biarmicus]